MSRITPVHWRTLVKLFELYGCEYRRKQGSHHILRCPHANRAVVIPEYEQVDTEIIKNNLRTAGMSREEYFALLEQVR
jgi:predicted RNA binding protein YcfA (HicA-like mRNA interferase family)